MKTTPLPRLRALLALALAAAPGAVPVAGAERPGPKPGEAGGAGLALRSRKVLTAALEGPQVIDHGRVLVKDGRIEAVGPASATPVPEGYVEIDVGEAWLMPGMIDLHCHIAAGNVLFKNDINDMVYLTNPGLRACAGVVPNNHLMRRGVGGGVTTVLFIPGSGTNMGGQGVLLKIGLERYEESELRNPGSLKLAQAGNPERWTIGVGRSFMNWNTRNTFKRGIAYAKRWEAFEQGSGEEPEKDLELEIFRALYGKEAQVSTHTQMYQVVLMTITMVAQELGLDAFIDHGSFDGYRTAALAQAAGVQAILGPRMIASTFPGFIDTDGKIIGMAAAYQERGHRVIGFNTDCIDEGVFVTPPQEELSLQAGMSVRYGLENTNLESVRGLTINPAIAAGIEDRVGSLEPGKDADVLVISGDPGDPRTRVERVYTDGRVVYDSATERRRW